MRSPARLCSGRNRRGLADLLLDERRDHVDIALVDEAATGVDEETAEPVGLGEAELLDGLEALQVLLLIDDQADVAVLDALRRGRREIEASRVQAARLEVRRLHVGRDRGR